jgi:nucleoside-diphosphate-sugar epimerase
LNTSSPLLEKYSPKIIVTGSGGFIGQRFMEYNRGKFEVIPLSLRQEIPAELDLQKANVVLHLAGKAHEMKQIDDKIYFDINFELTKKVADRALQQGVSLFIYMSSVKVYGDETADTLDEFSACNPTDAYGKSKLEAEKYLKSIESPSFKVAIIRPPMVYGPGVKGNMIRLLQLAEKNYPLPFAGIDNKRSMVFVDNLVELINHLMLKNANGTFMAGDMRAVSTAKLVTMMRELMNKPANLIKLPAFPRKILQHITPALYQRLFGSLEINTGHTNEVLGFVPPYSTEFGLKTMVTWWLSLKKQGNLSPAIK